MDRSFVFQADGICQITGHAIDARCIFFDGRSEVPEDEFFEELERALKSDAVLPDCAVVLAEPRLVEILLSYWDNNTDRRETVINRGSRKDVQFVKSFHFVSWGKHGIQEIPSKQGAAVHFQIPVETFVTRGLQELVKKNQPVQIAPSGHVFKHPSGTVNPVFIQARELIKVEPELCFVGRAICLAMRPEVLADLAVVYIDTMSIYPYLREALQFLESNARIHSYHSYEELEKLNPPHEPHLVVISASTSGGMARKLEHKQRFSPQRLLTMIDVTAKERSGKVLIALDEFQEAISKLIADGSETQIELVGEHFSSKAKPPRAVVLGIPHDPKPLEKILKQFGHDGFRDINTAALIAKKPRLICFDACKLAPNPAFGTWLEEEVQWRIPITTDLVIHADDAASKEIAASAAGVIAKFKGMAPSVLAAPDIHKTSLKGKGGALIVSACSGDGSEMREISRDLRMYLNAETPRHFLAGLGLPQSAESWDRLRQFLERNRTDRSYGFSAWLVMPVGPDGDGHAWDAYPALANTAQMNTEIVKYIDKTVAQAALDQMVTCIRGARNGFLPTALGQQLKITDGFYFFKKVFGNKLHEVKSSVSYLTVAAVLQTARDLKNPEFQLKPTGYESVVLHPECFLRFNDDILQACMLRACHPSELNYSASPHLSKLMKEFLIKVFARHDQPYGGCALEFAAVLASGRLKLAKGDMEDLIKGAIEAHKATPSPLLGFLLMAKLQHESG